ncbi:MAG: hypothetical protein ACYSUL_05840 [Planctomycetota bacterium]|jgi:hypothetical protein
MNTPTGENKYAQLLLAQGEYVITIRGIDWYDYKGFMKPAYLPHCMPEITEDIVKEVLKVSKRPFVRWETKFGKIENSQWWHVNRRGSWSLDQCSGNTRSKIRRGYKYLRARIITPEEALRLGHDVCRKAEKRYEKTGFVLSQEAYEKKNKAATIIKGVVDFFGVFCKDNLVAYSENYIQNNAVFWESIWFDPEFLPKYSSYVLIDAMLNYYLNEKKFMYVTDGGRCIFHRTKIQDYLMNVFGFEKEYAIIKVIYSYRLKTALKIAYPLRKLFWSLENVFSGGLFDNVGAVLRFEKIRRTCMDLD